jgi:two-component system response regulator MtrA
MDHQSFERSRFLILIADDGPALAALLRDILADEGYNSTCCFSGSAALRLIEQELPHLAILDLQMEHETAGLNVVEQIRRSAQLCHLPVILYSAAAPKLASLHQRLQALKCVSMPKPFNIDDLLGTVQAMLGTPNRDDGWLERELGR